MPDFFQTPMGSKYYNRGVPLVIKELKNLNENISIQNKLKKKELELKYDIELGDNYNYVK